MSMTFADLCKKLHLTKSYKHAEQLSTLEHWCCQHISTESCFAKDPEQRYVHFLSLAKTYLDVFLKYASPDISKKVPQLDQLDALQFAAVHGYDRFIETNIPKNHPALDEQNDMGMTPVHLSVVSDNLQSLKVLLAKGADPRIPNSESNLPLHSALFLSGIFDSSILPVKEAMFKMLLKQAPDTINSKGQGGNTVFHLMISNKFNDLFDEYLTKHPEGLFYCNAHTHYPIHTALLTKNVPALEQLLSKDKVMTLADAKKQTALHYAARYGTHDVLKAYCNATAADLDMRDIAQQTPMMLAASAGNLDAVELLKDQGADTTLVDYMNRTLLHLAVLSKNENLVTWVLNNTAVDINQEDAEHKLAIDYCKSPQTEAIASTLLSKGSRPAQSTNNIIRT